MGRFRNFYLVFGLLGLFLLQGCDEVAECVFGVNPEIHDKRLAMAVIGENYFEVITAEVENAVFDNSYIYNFDVYGELPPGVFFEINRRSIDLFGIPEETGTYYFSVNYLSKLLTKTVSTPALHVKSLLSNNFQSGYCNNSMVH